MPRRILLLGLFLALAIIGSQAALQAQGDCPGAPAPRLTAGNQGQVTPGDANNVRKSPGKDAELVGKIPAGAIFDVVDGPECADGFNWWLVSYKDVFGWTAEGASDQYFLQPYIPPTPIPVATVTDNSVTAVYGGVRFSFDRALASSVGAETLLPVEPIPDGGILAVAPQGIRFTLVGYPNHDPDNLLQPATVEIYPADGFGKLDSTVGKRIVDLRKLLDTQPASPKDEIPVAPIIPAAQVIHADMKYLSLPDGGKGVRFITYYAQDVSVATNNRLVYQFVALTDNGYYLFASFPVDASILPDDFDYSSDAYTQITNNFTQYLNDTVDKLTALPSSEYTPNLDLLDALVGSIQVQG
jgi:hypothetical protein